MGEEILTKIENTKKKLLTMSDALYSACETWDLATEARLAWLHAQHRSLTLYDDDETFGANFSSTALTQMLQFVQQTDSAVENYVDCFKPQASRKSKTDDELWEEAQKLGKASRDALDALLALVDAWREHFKTGNT